MPKPTHNLLPFGMFITEDLALAIENQLRALAPTDFRIQQLTPVPGGSINRAYRLSTAKTSYFIKINDGPDGSPLLLSESRGLAQLRSQGLTAHIPAVYAFGQIHGAAFLLMEWIPPTVATDKAMEQLGRVLARLHLAKGPAFGLEYNNYIGSLAQNNRMHACWADFFIAERLEKQLAIARRKGLIDLRLTGMFNRLYTRIHELFPTEEPSLLHGDLWSGNFLITTTNNPVLIDPAVYYGHREMDIAMTLLFGGFPQRFYAAYHEHYPLQDGWQERVGLSNLYPLLVHLNLFGGTYLDEIDTTLERFV